MKIPLSGLAQRIMAAKSLGFIFGLLGFFILPYLWAGADPMLRWGILFWYTTLGGLIGIFGVMDHHPLWPQWKFPAAFRGIFLGAWMNFLLVFFTHDIMAQFMLELGFIGLNSPWWFVLEGALVGLIIDLIATKHGGDGKALLT